jgi:hypothetical protein
VTRGDRQQEKLQEHAKKERERMREDEREINI